MNSPVYFDFPATWTAHDLANAVPLRLSALFDFDAGRDGPLAACANAAIRQPPARPWRQGYARTAPLPAAFRVG